ncbi:MAG: hypothetical protein GY845_03225 [Planctomycetes bacterium]|nr:hypothetical protein [Planctomycetota bacterium]
MLKDVTIQLRLKGNKMAYYYILEGHDVIPCHDMALWTQWLSSADRKVKRENVGESDVSTVFLGVNHAWDDGPPLVFETLVFDGPLDGEMERYSTWAEAVKGHDEMVERIRAKAAL